jgi:hypothetical protein
MKTTITILLILSAGLTGYLIGVQRVPETELCDRECQVMKNFHQSVEEAEKRGLPVYKDMTFSGSSSHTSTPVTSEEKIKEYMDRLQQSNPGAAPYSISGKPPTCYGIECYPWITPTSTPVTNVAHEWCYPNCNQRLREKGSESGKEAEKKAYSTAYADGYMACWHLWTSPTPQAP